MDGEQSRVLMAPWKHETETGGRSESGRKIDLEEKGKGAPNSQSRRDEGSTSPEKLVIAA